MLYDCFALLVAIALIVALFLEMKKDKIKFFKEFSHGAVMGFIVTTSAYLGWYIKDFFLN